MARKLGIVCLLIQFYASLVPATPAVSENKPRAEEAVQPPGPPHGLDTQSDLLRYGSACPDYTQYAKTKHRPYSNGPLELPSQRPAIPCRTFKSPLVEKIIDDIIPRMIDPDLAQIFANAFPNTLDTTVRWHVDGTQKINAQSTTWAGGRWQGAQSFIVTGDINAEWLRDSTNQLAQYQSLAKKDAAIHSLIRGAISTQAEYVIESPYCNAFQPPAPSRLQPTSNGGSDQVHPAYEPSFVFECKYELDSLAHFLSLANQFYDSTGSTEFLTPRFYTAIDTVLTVLDQQSKGTFDPKDGHFVRNIYTFKRHAWIGTETLNLDGIGNPLASGTGLIRSAFRPSDDATVFGFFIPANAMMCVELRRMGKLLQKEGGSSKQTLATNLLTRADNLEKAIYAHGTVNHKTFGEVFAYEVDGYGSALLMDDANLPSLLALPVLGFVSADDTIYQNTRAMILSQQGNPYYVAGPAFHGIGGPHIGVQNAWPMSLLVQAMTSSSAAEVAACLDAVKNVSRLGLVHESVSVQKGSEYTRSWFAWANSVFAQTILDLAHRMPEVLFGTGAKAWSIDDIVAADGA